MESKKAKPTDSSQLRFAFFTEPETNEGQDTGVGSSQSELEQAVMQARDALLDASLGDLDQQLPLVLEFCEAALTRALDTAQKRKGRPFSDAEYRSLRGIGQAHWLLVERHGREE